MSDQYQTIKVRRETYRRLKILAAHNDEKLMDLVDRLAREADSVTISDTTPQREDEQHTKNGADTAVERE